MKSDGKIINQLIFTIKESTNPFDNVEKDHLYNIATRKAAASERQDFLLNVEKVISKGKHLSTIASKSLRGLKKEFKGKRFARLQLRKENRKLQLKMEKL